MTPTAKTALLMMFNAFPVEGQVDMNARAHAFEEACKGCSDEAVIRASSDYVSGTVETHNRRFCPSSAEFGDHARTVHQRRLAVEAAQKRSQLPPPTSRFTGNVVGLQDRITVKMRSEGRQIIATEIELEEFRRHCARNEYPSGSHWVPTGDVWGPVPSASVAKAYSERGLADD